MPQDKRRGAAAFAVAAALAMAIACRDAGPQGARPAADEARAFIDEVNATMLRLGTEQGRAGWVYSTHITPDTEALNARANQNYIDAVAKYAKDAAKYDGLELPDDIRRQLNLLKLSLVMVTPADNAEAEELTKITARMESLYGRGQWCEDPRRQETCLDVEEITKVMAESRDEPTLRRVWEGWRTISPPMRPDYQRFVELANKGARELGYADSGAMWRSKYDMPPDEFAKEVDRLWAQVRPLYVSLHTYVRARLREKYGDVVPADGPIPAHLLGNIWAQDWSNVMAFAAPTATGPAFSLDEILKRRDMSAVDMVRAGERFYTSIGFAPLPQTFWDRSLFTKPPAREVVCHASAWNVDLKDDVRIKMCIDPTEEDFTTIHHELGHSFYQLAYNDLPVLFRDSANDGFHEAIGDTIALSVTPEYLVKIGLLDRAPDASGDIGLLLARALEKVAFLPFGLLVDQWRWKVFSGEVPPSAYNTAWWDLRLKYQGVAPPSPRGEEFFDPGAKYHVPANVPYTRYFLAHILQFQFHRELSKLAGCAAPLHRCSIYEGREAGKRLNAMLEMGLSRPWPDALEAMTSSRQMDATAIRDYFAPLQKWLDERNRGSKAGW